MRKLSLSALMSIMVLVVNAQTATWVTEENGSHSSIGFALDHLVISEVTGEFEKYKVTVESAKEDFTDSKISFETEVASINTKDENRDKHLKSGDFFDVEKFSKISFVGKTLTKIEGKKYQLTGDLTIKGVTKLVTFDVRFGGTIKDPWGGTRAGFKITGAFDRNDFGLKYNSVLDSGGFAIGEEVRIVCNLELIKQA